MRGFAADAVEPLVGEIRAVRSFSLSDDGRLFPVSGSTAPWLAGRNTAVCTRGHPHEVPASDCTCGFYAYLDPGWITPRTGITGTVTAIVACWGETILGSRGVRTQFARIEAVTLPADVPDEVVAAVREAYPDVVVFRDIESMFAGYPLSRLDGVREPRLLSRVRPTPTMLCLTYAAYAAALVLILALGLDGSHFGLSSVMTWSISAALVLARLVPVDGPARTWRRLLLPSVPQILVFGCLPWLLADTGDGYRGVLADLWLVVAVLSANGVLRRWRARDQGTIVSPDHAAREVLRKWRGSSWQVAETDRRGWRQLSAVSADDGSVLTYLAVPMPPSKAATIPRLPILLGLGFANQGPLLRKDGLVSIIEKLPSSDWVHVSLGSRVNLRTDHTGQVRMSIHDVIEALGLPPEALGR